MFNFNFCFCFCLGLYSKSSIQIHKHLSSNYYLLGTVKSVKKQNMNNKGPQSNRIYTNLVSSEIYYFVRVHRWTENCLWQCSNKLHKLQNHSKEIILFGDFTEERTCEKHLERRLRFQENSNTNGIKKIPSGQDNLCLETEATFLNPKDILQTSLHLIS